MKKERTGLWIRFDKDTHICLKKAFVHYAKWLRCHYNFPKRVSVYVKSSYFIITWITREQVSASFFGPFDKNEKSYIRIATGDFYDLEKEDGRRDAILSTLNSLSHELQHYYQWIDDDELLEDNVEEWAKDLTWEYIEDGFEEFWSSLDGEL